VIDQLETLILVERRAYPGDRRAKGLWLTDEGRKVAAMIEAELDLMRQRILAHVDQLDIVATLRVFRAFEDLECI
jgi:MarR family transcriptional regulator for hemolysin